MNNLVLNDRYAAGHHAILSHENSRFTITHTNKTGSTWVNDESLSQDATISLSKGDTLKIGKTFFQILEFRMLPLRPSTLILKLKHTKKIMQVNAQNVFVIGSSQDSHLILLDEAVLPQHAVIFRKDNGFYISNLSPSGITIRHQSDLIQLGIRQENLLVPGTRVRIANYDFKIMDVKYAV